MKEGYEDDIPEHLKLAPPPTTAPSTSGTSQSKTKVRIRFSIFHCKYGIVRVLNFLVVFQQWKPYTASFTPAKDPTVASTSGYSSKRNFPIA